MPEHDSTARPDRSAPHASAGSGEIPVENRIYTRRSLPEGEYIRVRKTYAPLAVRMTGTFHCETSEGNIASCSDGWLAVDSHGYPYPVNANEFSETYERLGNTEPGDV